MLVIFKDFIFLAIETFQNHFSLTFLVINFFFLASKRKDCSKVAQNQGC
jgi:hypothetical protein